MRSLLIILLVFLLAPVLFAGVEKKPEPPKAPEAKAETKTPAPPVVSDKEQWGMEKLRREQAEIQLEVVRFQQESRLAIDELQATCGTDYEPKPNGDIWICAAKPKPESGTQKKK